VTKRIKTYKNFDWVVKYVSEFCKVGVVMQLRQMEIVTDKDKLSVDIQETCMKYKTIKQWAYILHDKDDTRPHYHIYLNFDKSSCDTKLVASWFGIPDNFIEKVKGRKADMLMYLTHGNESQKNKYQYSPTEVIANFDFETEIENSKIIGDFEKYSYAEQLRYVNSLPIVEKSKAYTQLKKLWELHCQCLTLNTDRNIKVMFVTGKAGTGKTYYAKQLLDEVLKYDYCISSSSNDPFQDYLGQKAIILDDLRDDHFKFEDLLKILDNNTSSSAKSRFSNKVFNGEMIVLTSSVPLKYWYKELRYNSIDTLDQLYRRITCYVTVTEDEVTVFNDGLDKFGNPSGLGTIFKNKLKDNNRKSKEKFDFSLAFAKICEPLSVQFEVQGNFLKEK